MLGSLANDWLPLIILMVALTTAMLMLLVREQSEKLRTVVNLSSAAINIVLIFIMLAGVSQGQVFETRLPLLPDISLVFNADPLSMVFVGLSGVLWFFTTLYAVGYFRHGKHRSRFFGFFSLCVFSTLGIALAGNLITFLIFYELLTLATYPLIVHKGNDASLQSGKVYLRYTMVGGAVLMVGVVWLKSIAGALDFATPGLLANTPDLSPAVLTVIFVFLLVGLGVKAALFPLHGWLPRAMSAPAPVSSLLHAVAVVKAGAFGIIRVVYDVYGIELSSTLGVIQVLVLFACFTIIYGSVRAIFQNDIKKRLAYSTVSQVSYITLGIALAGPIAAVGAIAHLVHQGVMKITMFFCAGNLAESQHIYKVTELDGVARKMPVTMAAFTLAVFGMIGIPPLAGFVSKWYLGVGAIESGYPWVIAILAGSSLLNAIYFLPLVYRAWFLPPPVDITGSSDGHQEPVRAEAHWMMLLPPLFTITVAMLAGVFANSDASALAWAKLIVAGESGGDLFSTMATASLDSLGNGHLLGAAILLPGLLALLLWFVPRLSNLKYLLPVCAIPAVYLGLQPLSLAQGYPAMFFGSWLVLDPVSQSYLLLAGILWFLGSLYSCFYYGLGDNQRQFFTLFAIAMASSFGLVLSSDMFGFLTFFTCMSLASYVLIIRGGMPEARKAANTYIKWVIVGEVAIFSGFCVINYLGLGNELAGSALLPIMAIMMVVGFGIKIGLFGFHGWLPLAHPVAVVPASALLSGFMVKAGMVGWLKFFPLTLEDASFAWVGLATIVLGITGAFYAALVGITKTNPKAVLAYSTVSQMGILSCCFGTIMLAPESRELMIPVILFYSIHHGLAKSALFLSVGAGNLLNKRAYNTPILTGCLYLVILIPALSLVGAPLLSGYFAKTELKQLLTHMPYLKMAITISSVFTGLLMCRFVHQLHAQATQTKQGQTAIAPSKPQKYLPLLLITGLNTLVLLLSPWYLQRLIANAESIAGAFGVSNLFYAALPVILSVALYWLLRKFLPGNRQQQWLESLGSIAKPVLKVQATIFNALVPAASFGRELAEQPSHAKMEKISWLEAQEHVTKNMNSPSIAVLLMVICLLLVVSLAHN